MDGGKGRENENKTGPEGVCQYKIEMKKKAHKYNKKSKQKVTTEKRKLYHITYISLFFPYSLSPIPASIHRSLPAPAVPR